MFVLLYMLLYYSSRKKEKEKYMDEVDFKSITV